MSAFVPFWFIVIAILWTGFFVLEGFDFGVGMLHSVVGRNDAERRAAINTIGPLWDGNEVWLIVAGAAMFAAFPGWYATMFSGLYLALVLLLAVALGDLLHGLPIDAKQEFTGSFFDLLQPYALFTGVTLVLLCLLYGAAFLALKTTDELHERSRRVARRVAPVTAAAVVAFVIW